MKTLKKMLGNYLIMSLICIALGVMLVIDPTILTKTVSYILGGLAILLGVINGIQYFTKADDDRYFLMVVKAVIFVAAGVFILIKPDFIPKVISVIFGLYMLINGIVNLTNAIQIKRANDNEWLFPAVSAGITTAVGLIIVVNPLAPINIAMTILGVCLIISGVTNVFGCFSARSKLKALAKAASKDDDNKHNGSDIIDI